MRGLATVIKYNGWLLEPCQAEAWSKTMVGLWTGRNRGSAERTELLSPSAALIQALFNTSPHPSSDQHQPLDKPAHCVLREKKIMRTNPGRTDSHSPGERPSESRNMLTVKMCACVSRDLLVGAPLGPAKSRRQPKHGQQMEYHYFCQ